MTHGAERIDASLILPDALDEHRLVIIKSCRQLRLTQEILIAESVALETDRTFVLAVPEDCTLSEPLDAFIRARNVDLRRIKE